MKVFQIWLHIKKLRNKLFLQKKVGFKAGLILPHHHGMFYVVDLRMFTLLYGIYFIPNFDPQEVNVVKSFGYSYCVEEPDHSKFSNSLLEQERLEAGESIKESNERLRDSHRFGQNLLTQTRESICVGFGAFFVHKMIPTSVSALAKKSLLAKTLGASGFLTYFGSHVVQHANEASFGHLRRFHRQCVR